MAHADAKIHANDPDTIILEACSPEEATISLAGIVAPAPAPDPLPAAVVAALVAGRGLPEEFVILDTYAAAGWPPSWEDCRQVCDQVQAIMAARGLPIRRTHTMLDRA